MHVTSSLHWDATQRWLVVSYQSFGTAYGSNLQGSSSPVFLEWTLRNRRTYTLVYSSVDEQWNYFLFWSVIFHSCVKCLRHMFVYINTYTNIIRACLWRILLSPSHSYVQVHLWSLNMRQYKIKISFFYCSFNFVGFYTVCEWAVIYACGVTKRACGLQRLKTCLKFLMLK